MLAKSPLLTLFAYILMFGGFWLMFTGTTSNDINLVRIASQMLAGFGLSFISVVLFFYLLSKDRKLREQERNNK